MNVSLLKLITILSSFLGLACGILAVIPFIDGIVLFVLMCLSSFIVLILMMKLNVIKLESVPESITIGGMIGFISYIAFSVIYIPLVILLMRGFQYYTNEGVALTLSHANLFVIIVVSIFMAILSATVNAFTGFLLYYVTELLENIGKK